MRPLAFIQYCSVIIGILAMIAGRFFALPNGFHLGVFMVGAGIALAGIEALATRRMGFRPSDDAWESCAGMPALIVGMMALVVGAGVIAAAYLLSEGAWQATVHHLARRPAPLLAGAGALLVGLGVLPMLNPAGRTGWAWRILVYLPRSLFGLVLLLAGLAGIGLGVWEWFEPQAFDRFVRKLPEQLLRLPYSAWFTARGVDGTTWGG